MPNFDLAALLIWLGDVVLIIAIVVICCYGRRRRRDREAAAAADRRQEAAAAASHAHPAPAAAAVQMAAMAVALLDHVTYPRQNVGGDSGGGDDHGLVAAAECAICLGQFEDGDRCSVMPVCCHEFHRSCIAKWLTACNNTCPLCRAQLQWDVVARDMV